MNPMRYQVVPVSDYEKIMLAHIQMRLKTYAVRNWVKIWNGVTLVTK